MGGGSDFGDKRTAPEPVSVKDRPGSSNGKWTGWGVGLLGHAARDAALRLLNATSP